jgi:hypothetical protein
VEEVGHCMSRELYFFLWKIKLKLFIYLLEMRFGTWNVRSLYRSRSLTTVVRDLAKGRLDLLDVWEVRWDKGGTFRTENYSLFSEKEINVIYL